MNQRGFTLIELLVVISIISLLSSIVLVSVQTSRVKARDAAIKSEMTQLRNAIELAYSNNYNGMCTEAPGWWRYPIDEQNPSRAHSPNPNVDALFASIYERITQNFPAGGGTIDCFDPNLKRQGWWVVATLKSGNWCVDSGGNSRKVPGWSSGWIDCNGGSIW